jgi:MFS transporter, FHS family, glucose/mannose:H+ symporter
VLADLVSNETGSDFYKDFMQRPSRTTVALLTAGCFLAFFVFGITDNLKGPTLPSMMEEMNISYGTGGNIFFGQYLGFLIATLFTGFLGDRFGLKSVILLAGVFLLGGVLGYSSFHSTWLMAGSVFLLGLGFGAMELGPNALIVSIHRERKGLFLNMMSVFHGMGSMIAPFAAGWLLNASVPWRAIYRWEALFILAFFLYFLWMRFPKKENQERETLDFRQLPKVAFKPTLNWYYLSIALYVASEIGIASWLVTYLQQEGAASITASTAALTFFFGTIMLGRFLGGFLVQRIGYLRSIFLASLASILCITVGLFGPSSLSFCLPLTGLFFSIIFPTITAAVSDTHTETTNSILGVLFASAGLGGLVGPWIIGWASEAFGLRVGFSITLLFVVLMAVSFAILLRRKKHEYTPT